MKRSTAVKNTELGGYAFDRTTHEQAKLDVLADRLW
jgi:hypothetical protein